MSTDTLTPQAPIAPHGTNRRVRTLSLFQRDILKRALIDSFLKQEGALAAAPSLGGRRANPVLVGRGLFEAAMGLTGDEGARRLIGALSAGELVEIAGSHAQVTFDIDTPGDLAVARRAQSGEV